MKNFSYDKGPVGVGEPILEALLNSSINTLVSINLSANKLWFEENDSSVSSVELLIEAIGMQSGLEHLIFDQNSLSQNVTQKVLTKIADSSVCNSIKSLTMSGSFGDGANFDSDISVEKLAHIIQQAPALAKLDISGQLGFSRKIKVKVMYAYADAFGEVDQDGMGAIIIKDRNTK